MNGLTLDYFSEIIDNFLKENEIHMLLSSQEGTLDVQVDDNTGLGSTVQFYILLNAIKPIAESMRKILGIDVESPEWAKTVNALLELVKAEMLCGEAQP